MSDQHFVIIGNGPAGNSAALTLAEKSPGSRVTVISRQQGGFYRPNFLPHYIAGNIQEEDLYIFSPSSYKEKGIRLRAGQEVVGIDLEHQEIIFDHKELLPYTGLIIAAGGCPRIPEPLSCYKEFMLTLKTLEDASVWVEKLENASTVLMIGGDLTSLSLTKQLLGMGKKVIFMLNEESFWPVRCNNELFESVAERLSNKGVEVLKESPISGMERLPDSSIEVETESEKINVDLVGAFFGLIPDIGFLAKSGLKVDRGVIVDEYLHTGFNGVYATGDCAQIYHPELRDYWVSIGHDNAVSLGRTAALNLTGEKIEAKQPRECIFNVQGITVNTSWWMEF